MDRYICIHGHFYQPPRENAWLEHVELQDEAFPFHDWNERISAECYEPNSVSRILDDEGYIISIGNNYTGISYDFGPTLLSWMKKASPVVYHAVLDADRRSMANFSGHGSAMAQAYNHIIMPLANHRDRYTQVFWGISDFEHRYGRRPEGMWLPETAVDVETLEIMADLGITFTVLAPHQAKRVRKTGTTKWQDVPMASIDPTRAYRANLPSGRSIALFFYDGPISRAVAFEDLLTSGEGFAKRLTGAFSEKRAEAQLVHIATDGETYGHHHRFGDMALAYALNYIKTNKLAKVTNYGEFLERFPPAYEVEINERTSWSCMHGVDRWWSDCGDNTGGHPDWNQAWRTPLRESLDWLRDATAGQYEERARQYLKDPWLARDQYINVILNRSPENVDAFLGQHGTRPLDERERTEALKLLELQRHAMLMYTSCGWFFDDVSGIETVQVIQYAGRVVQLAQELFGDATEEKFLRLLEKAESNIPEQGNGRDIYERYVRPAVVDLNKVAAHYAIDSLFESYEDRAKIYCYDVDREDYETAECGKTKLITGQCRITSEITKESVLRDFGVYHFGDHVINAGVAPHRDEDSYKAMIEEMTGACSTGDFTELVRLLDKYFGESSYSLKSLFRDEQRKVLGYILESTITDIESTYRQLYEASYPPMRFLAELGGPVPRAFSAAAELIVNMDLHRAVNSDDLDVENVRGLIETAREWRVDLDGEGLGFEFEENLDRQMSVFFEDPGDTGKLQRLIESVRLVGELPFTVNLWRAQNLYWNMLQTRYKEAVSGTAAGDAATADQLELFKELGRQLKIRVK